MAGVKGLKLGAYDLLDCIGRGGMAEVFRARQHKAFDREVAIKVIKRGFAEDDLFRQRFLREAQATARLSHPHILPLIELGQVGRDREILFLVMPYVRGGTLRDLLERTGGPLPFELTAHIFVQLCAAVHYAHEHGLVHRDIKPSNILLQTEQHILLADFGIALDTEDARLTSTGLGMGTAEYTAPEQAQGFADARSDLYSLGIVLFELLTGSVPFTGRTPFEILFKHTTVPAPLLRAVYPHLPEGLDRLDVVLQRVLAKEPDERFQSAAELSVAFRTLLTQAPDTAVLPVVSVSEARLPEPLMAGAAPPALATPARGASASVAASNAPEHPDAPAAVHARSKNWSPPQGFFPLPVAPVEHQGVADDEQKGNGGKAGADLVGEQPTLLATAAALGSPPSIRSRQHHPRFRWVFLLLFFIGGALVFGSGTLLFINGWFSTHQNTPSFSVNAPAATATLPTHQTATALPTRLPGITPTSARPSSTRAPQPTPTTVPAHLVVTPGAVAFSVSLVECLAHQPQKMLTLQNSGGVMLNWQASVQNPSYLSVSPTNGMAGGGASKAVAVSLICPTLPVQITDTIHFTSNGGTQDVVVTIDVS